MATKIQAGQVIGLKGHIIDVEIDITGRALYNFAIVGDKKRGVSVSKKKSTHHCFFGAGRHKKRGAGF